MADSVVPLAEKTYRRTTSASPPLGLNISTLLRITAVPSQRRTVTRLKQCELTRLFITCKEFCCSELFGYNGEGTGGFLHRLRSPGSTLQNKFEPQSDSMSDFCQLSSLSLPQFQVIWIPWQPVRINQAQKVFQNSTYTSGVSIKPTRSHIRVSQISNP